MKKLILAGALCLFLFTPRSFAAPVSVLVELYTSEGCSSCPPADTVLSSLVQSQPVPGATIIALGEHVDYWNHGGWADPFSSALFSVRQSDYASFFHNSSVYTPQAIVDGRAEFVGSDRRMALAAIARAARAPKAQVQVMNAAASGARAASLNITVRSLPAVSGGDTAQVWLAVTEDGLQSQVRGGENSGRTLHHTAVVRRMTLLGTAQAGHEFARTVPVALEAGWQAAKLHAVVFVQERGSRRILGVGVGRV